MVDVGAGPRGACVLYPAAGDSAPQAQACSGVVALILIAQGQSVHGMVLNTTFGGQRGTDYRSTVPPLGTECDGVIAIVLLSTGPQSRPAAFVIRVGVGVRAVALCRG